MIDIELPNTELPPPTISKPREFLRPLPQDGHYLLILDNSALEHFTKCPTSALHYLIYRREAHARNAALTFGGAIHEGIKGYLLGESAQEQDQRIVQYFTENPSPPDEYRTVGMALRVMAHYRIQDLGWEILEDNGEQLIEKPFEIPLGRLDVNTKIRLPEWPEPRHVEAIHVAWSGRIDLVAHVNGHNRVVDHKTTSIGGDQYIPAFQLAHQTIGYTWVARILWPELDITGFCLDGIGLRRVQEDTKNLIAKGPRGGEAPLTFFKAFFDYTQERLEKWEANTLTITSDLVHCLVRNQFPMFTNSCFGKYGKCQYHDACTIENDQVRLRFLNSDSFKPVTWNPVL
jgi:PD-(D/E)XK nuclease superfamily